MTPMHDRPEPSHRLRRLLDERWGGSDRSFADELGIDPVTLSRLVNGKSDLRKSPNAARIAQLLRVTTSELLFGQPEDQRFEDGVRLAVDRMEAALTDLRTAAGLGHEGRSEPAKGNDVLPDAHFYNGLKALANLPDPDGRMKGVRIAVAFEQTLGDRLRGVDRQRWEAFKDGRRDVDWENVEPWDEVPFPTDVLSDIEEPALPGLLGKDL